MVLEPGSKLAHYEILSSLGAGGMGEVYRAKDTKLGREVAIKLLLAEVSADTERLARFVREAVEGNPLDDIRELEDVDSVMKSGRVVKGAHR